MPHRFKSDFSRLESEERKKILPVERILDEMNIKNGDTIIDFGCGIGYISIPALDFVGEEGVVIAVDIAKDMLQELAKRAGYHKNLRIVHSDSLVKLTADIILLSMVLHEIDDPKAFLKTCVTSLKSFGRVIVIDWEKKDTGSMGPPIEDRLAKEAVIQFTSMKYRVYPIHDWVYFLEFFKG